MLQSVTLSSVHCREQPQLQEYSSSPAFSPVTPPLKPEAIQNTLSFNLYIHSPTSYYITKEVETGSISPFHPPPHALSPWWGRRTWRCMALESDRGRWSWLQNDILNWVASGTREVVIIWYIEPLGEVALLELLQHSETNGICGGDQRIQFYCEEPSNLKIKWNRKH